ncbi:JJJ3 (YJR097W) [Zygosaccharomyces parabailii]|nr:JJJ3 (YJR097W) [Zygosaccharomyces parabailii]CDH09738.1 related to Diphthamide biosynthesis protein 4 [Zygosaccharomyces bailii ISA1307]
MVSHYEVLGVKFDSTLSEIKEAYRCCLLRTHPDKLGGVKSSERIDVNAIQDAYRVLSDSDLRLRYNKEVIQVQKSSGYVGTGDGLDEYSLDSFEFDATKQEYSMDCPRCMAKSGFSFYENTLEEHADDDLNGGFVVLSQCCSCSLWLKINFQLAAEEDGKAD